MQVWTEQSVSLRVPQEPKVREYLQTIPHTCPAQPPTTLRSGQGPVSLGGSETLLLMEGPALVVLGLLALLLPEDYREGQAGWGGGAKELLP